MGKSSGAQITILRFIYLCCFYIEVFFWKLFQRIQKNITWFVNRINPIQIDRLSILSACFVFLVPFVDTSKMISINFFGYLGLCTSTVGEESRCGLPLDGDATGQLESTKKNHLSGKEVEYLNLFAAAMCWFPQAVSQDIARVLYGDLRCSESRSCPNLGIEMFVQKIVKILPAVVGGVPSFWKGVWRAMKFDSVSASTSEQHLCSLCKKL